jgi:hypothetical protein
MHIFEYTNVEAIPLEEIVAAAGKSLDRVVLTVVGAG